MPTPPSPSWGFLTRTNDVFKEPIESNLSATKEFVSPGPANRINEPLTEVGEAVSLSAIDQSLVSRSPPKSPKGLTKPFPVTPRPEETEEVIVPPPPKPSKLNLAIFGVPEAADGEGDVGSKQLIKPRKSSIGQPEDNREVSARDLRKTLELPVKRQPAPALAPNPTNFFEKFSLPRPQNDPPSSSFGIPQPENDRQAARESMEKEQGSFALNFLRNISKSVGGPSASDSSQLPPLFPRGPEPLDADGRPRQSRRKTLLFANMVGGEIPDETIEEQLKSLIGNSAMKGRSAGKVPFERSRMEIIGNEPGHTSHSDQSPDLRRRTAPEPLFRQPEVPQSTDASQFRSKQMDTEGAPHPSQSVHSQQQNLGPIDRFYKSSEKSREISHQNVSEQNPTSQPSVHSWQQQLPTEGSRQLDAPGRPDASLGDQRIVRPSQIDNSFTVSGQAQFFAQTNFQIPSEIQERGESRHRMGDNRIELSSGKKKDRIDNANLKRTLMIQPKPSNLLGFESYFANGMAAHQTPFSQHYFNQINLLRQKMEELESLIKAQATADIPFRPDLLSEDLLRPSQTSENLRANQAAVPHLINDRLKDHLVSKVILTSILADRVKKIKETAREIKAIKTFVDDHLALLGRTSAPQFLPESSKTQLALFISRLFGIKLMRVELVENAQFLKYTVVCRDCFIMKFETFIEVKNIKSVEVYLLDHPSIKHLDSRSRGLISDVVIENFHSYIKMVDNVSIMDAVVHLSTHFIDILDILTVLDKLNGDTRLVEFILTKEGSFDAKLVLLRTPDVAFRLRLEVNVDLKWRLKADLEFTSPEAALKYRGREEKLVESGNQIVETEFNSSAKKLDQKLEKTLIHLMNIYALK